MRQHFAATVKIVATAVIGLVAIGMPLSEVSVVHGATLLSDRYDRLSTSVAGATATHLIGLTVNELGTPLGSVQMEFCSNSPLFQMSCEVPVGFDLSGATLAAQTGNSGFSIHGSSTVNKLILTRPAALPEGSVSTYQLEDVVNPSAAGSYYLRLRTFPTEDASGEATEEGGVAFAINSGLNVETEVPPHLKFCAGTVINDYDCATATTFALDLGDFSTNFTSTAASQMVVATNADFGFSLTMSGTTLTSGNNTIPAINPGGAAVAGTSQFGLNLRANTAPLVGSEPTGPGVATISPGYNAPNVFRFVPNEVIVTSSGATDLRKFTLSYVANVSDDQAPGVYATTLSFICLANF